MRILSMIFWLIWNGCIGWTLIGFFLAHNPLMGVLCIGFWSLAMYWITEKGD